MNHTICKPLQIKSLPSPTLGLGPCPNSIHTCSPRTRQDINTPQKDIPAAAILSATGLLQQQLVVFEGCSVPCSRCLQEHFLICPRTSLRCTSKCYRHGHLRLVIRKAVSGCTHVPAPQKLVPRRKEFRKGSCNRGASLSSVAMKVLQLCEPQLPRTHRVLSSKDRHGGTEH